MNFIHKVPLAPSKCLSKWIKVDKWDYFQNGPQDFFSLFSFLFSLLILIFFFKYETTIRSSAWSFGHSDPDPSSVNYKMIFAQLTTVPSKGERRELFPPLFEGAPLSCSWCKSRQFKYIPTLHSCVKCSIVFNSC